MTELPNPCPIDKILEYSKTVPLDPINDNKYIEAVYHELICMNVDISKSMIVAIFQLAMHYASKTQGQTKLHNYYIDVGCAILSFATLAKDKYSNIYINLTNGDISVSNDVTDTESLELEHVQGHCNSIKQIIVDIFSPKVPD